ncbi:L,D-transpeptidase family protein [Tropicimonas sp. S265A]|uniref:L,D-transpeptidase family protein n=1 Tax=Tropicimonas sp. S265A TaxID=3415134 RepID=UPI003C7C5068
MSQFSIAHRSRLVGLLVLAMSVCLGAVVQADSFAYRQAVAEAAVGDETVLAFYAERDFAPVWTAPDATDHRKALLRALQSAPVHGLPADRYDAEALHAAFAAADNPRARGFAEILAARMYLAYAQDVHSGALDASRIDAGIVREQPRRDRADLLHASLTADPHAMMSALPPQSAGYTRLLKAKLDLERAIAAGGWGPKVQGGKLELGDTGAQVVALRNRMIRMGYLRPTAQASYTNDLKAAVLQFQADHGLAEDGVAAKVTLGEVNISATERLKSVLVALERERWMNRDLGDRRIMVNIVDFHARVIEDNAEVFRTRVVVGKNTSDRRTPEFSDEMDHMVINPTWNVPRSIATKEYLPKFQNDPNAHSYLRLVDASGRTVSRDSVDFTQMTARNFPFDIKQPPSRSNALGLVKFMFPNEHNIYLHDTPAKSLFGRESRAYSHGCVRVADPFDFAYELLSKQEADPEGAFKSTLATGKETWVYLDEPLPVHLYYQTAFAPADGHVQYRRDVYGRDARIWKALADAGVALPAFDS